MRHGFISHSTGLTIRCACMLLLFCGLTGAIETTLAQTRAYTTNRGSEEPRRLQERRLQQIRATRWSIQESGAMHQIR